MKPNTTTLAVVTVAVALMWPALTQCQELDRTEQQIWSLEESYWAALQSGDLDAAMGLWHEAAIVWPANARDPQSRELLGTSLAEAMANLDEGDLKLEAELLAIQVEGAVAAVAIGVTGFRTSSRGRKIPVDDRTVHTWIKEKKQWRIVSGMAAARMAEPQEDPRVALDRARELASEGRYAEALEEHLWFHENALRIRPSLAGVRLSFALAAWIELGAEYPEAIDEMVALREEKTATLAGGEIAPELFFDVDAYNHALEQREKTRELFLSIHAEYPEAAARYHHVVQDLLVEHGDYEICAAYLEDHRLEFEKVAQLRGLNLEHANRDPDQPDLRMTLYADQNFIEGVVEMVEVYTGIGDDETAESVIALALGILDNEEIRAAIEGATARATQAD
jgi:ketosteroid isomerase-like protein